MDRSSPVPSSSKNPEVNGPQGFRPQVNMTVQPPRQEDLQRSYAGIVANDADAKGWYGTMSTSQSTLTNPRIPIWSALLTSTVANQSTVLVPLLEPWVPFHAASSARTRTRT